MEKFRQFVGIDVSKQTVDVTVIFGHESNRTNYFQLENSNEGVNHLLHYLKKEKVRLPKVLFCLEHTGLYGAIVINSLLKKKANVWVEMPYTIKHSMGIQRGKSDKVDSLRIAQYAFRFQDKAQLYRLSSSNLERIKTLLAMREKLIRAGQGLKKHLTELKKFDPDSYKMIRYNIEGSITNLKKNARTIDDKMDTIIEEDHQLRLVYEMASSVTGVGRITTLYLMTATNLFTKCSNPKQLASYCGVVPFQYTSGKSVKKQPRVHFMANKKLKSLLHLCALSAARYDQGLKIYFERKVEQGKNPMLVLNNVRNKLVHRIYAVVKRESPYIKVA
ncbi:MAG: IS110 family transposase [Saprospiraceae bacterium]|nr:IS110 family transposase [Saprospiraceae bacterium]